MKKRVFATLLAFLLVLQFTNLTGLTKQTEAAFVTDKDGFVFSKVSLMDGSTEVIKIITNLMDNTVTDTQNPNYRFEFDSNKLFEIKYDWVLKEDHTFTKDDTVVFQLPAGLKLKEAIPNTTDAGEIPGLGKYTADLNGKVTMIFDENVTDREIPDGFIKFWAYLDKQDNNIKQDLVFTDIADKTFTFDMQSPFPNEYISKEGIAKPQDYNGKSIEWTIDINKGLNNIKQATIKDTIEGGLELDSVIGVKVYKVNYDLQSGAEISANLLSAPADYSITLPDDNISQPGTLEVNLGDITDAYRIVYHTKITDTSEDSPIFFNNTATLTGTDLPSKTDSDTVEITRGNLLEKNVDDYNDIEQTIDWEIIYNAGELTIANPKIIDMFDDVHEFVPGSLVIKDATDNIITGQFNKSDDISVVPNNANKKGFILTSNTPLTGKIIITYQTKAAANFLIYRDTDERNVNNTVISEGKDKDQPQWVKQRFTSKNYSINYSTREITWTVKINENKYDITNVKYEDVFPDGLQLVGGLNDIIVKKDGATPNPVIVPVNGVDKSGVTVPGFTVALDNGPHSYTIIYKTKYDFDPVLDTHLKSNYKNVGEVFWTDNTGSQSKTFNSTFTPNENTVNNGFKENGKYDASTKKITWAIGVNYNSKNMTNVRVIDELQSVQEYVSGSLKVYPLSIKTDGSWNTPDLGTAIADLATVESYENQKLTIKFNQAISTPYYITFETTLKDSIINDATIKNKATITADNVSDKTTNEASVKIPKAGTDIAKELIKKSGQSPFIASWKITINQAQSQLDHAKIIDTPSNNQVILPNSFKLYKTSVASDGSISKISPDAITLDPEDPFYTVIIDEKAIVPTFELLFNKPISTAYILEYDTFIDADPSTNPVISNTVKLKNGVEEIYGLEKPVEETIHLSGSSAGGSYADGKLTIRKTDADSGDPLSGATFKLTRASNGKLIGEQTTDSSGEITFGPIPFGNYIIEEVSAPKYYNIDGDGKYPVSINSTTELIQPVVNKMKETGKLTIKKIETKSDPADPDKFLANATFELYEQDVYESTPPGAPKDTKTTGIDGSVTFENLHQDFNYVIVEKTAPYGYHVYNNGIYKNIVLTSSNHVEVISNSKEPVGKFEITKTDANDPTTFLAGVKFQLAHKDFPNVVVDTLVTDEHGKATSLELPYGEYIITEVKTNFGYVIDVSQNIILDKTTKPVEIKNKKAPDGELVVTKVAKHDNTRTLAGAEFQLLDADRIVRATGSTNANGELILTGVGGNSIVTDGTNQPAKIKLPVGKYILKETKAPAGYILNYTEFPVEIKENDPVSLTVENQIYIPGPVITPTPTPEPSPEPTDPVEPTDPGETDNPTPTPSPGEPGPTPTPGPSGTPGTPGPENPIDEDDDNNGPANPGKGGEDDTDIDDEEVPLGGGTGTPGVDKLPKTGQDSYLAVQLAGAALVLIGIILVARRRLAMKK